MKNIEEALKTRHAIKNVWFTKIIHLYSESLVSGIPHGIHVVIDKILGLIKYKQVETLTLLDDIKFNITLYDI